MGLGRRNNRASGRLSRSGHTSHAPAAAASGQPPGSAPPQSQPPRYEPPRSEDPRYQDPRYARSRAEDVRRDNPRYADPAAVDPRAAEPPRYPPSHYDEPQHSDRRYDGPRYDGPRYDGPRYDGPAYRGPGRDDSPRVDPRYDTTRYDTTRYDRPPPGRPADGSIDHDPRYYYGRPRDDQSSSPDRAYDDRLYDQRGYPDRGYDDRAYDGRGRSPAADGYVGPRGPVGSSAQPFRELPPEPPPPATGSSGPPATGPGGPVGLTTPFDPVGGITAGGATSVGPVVGPGGKVTVTRAVAHRSKQAAQTVTRKVVAASQADGAKESGLTPLIWNQVLSFGADAMITVALAGTVFFGATQGAQKGNVLGYLLITMAPFAVVAPIIGPVLDRLQHGRRWAMAGTSFGRALLAVLMAQNFDNLLVLFPLALGSLVLSKAYSVVRAAAAPRVVPDDMTLVSANARLSIFGLGAAIVGGGFIAAVIKLTHSYSFGLWLTAIAFAVTGYFSLRLPRQVDSANDASRHPEEPPRPTRTTKVPPSNRIRDWVSRGFDPKVIIAMQGESVLRWASGFLTLFLAFYIQHTSHGFDAAAALGGIGLGVGLGNFVGTASGARIKLAHPEVIVLICMGACTTACIIATFTFSLLTSILCMFITSAANSLGKLSLDAVVQRDVSETLRSSAFAKSETFLQLAWVFGATVALLLPVNKGTLGLAVASTFLGVTTVIILLRNRAVGRSTQPGARPAPGTV